jgi:hypothetical protein
MKNCGPSGPQVGCSVIDSIHSNNGPGGQFDSPLEYAPSDSVVKLEHLLQLFCFPAKEAATKLQIGVTKLKTVCRRLGMCLCSDGDVIVSDATMYARYSSMVL